MEGYTCPVCLRPSFRLAAGSPSRVWSAHLRSSAFLPPPRTRPGLINTDACDNATLTQPFAPWGDSNSYKLVPGGDFEGSLTGWTLIGRCQAGGRQRAVRRHRLGREVLDVPAGRRERPVALHVRRLRLPDVPVLRQEQRPAVDRRSCRSSTRSRSSEPATIPIGPVAAEPQLGSVRADAHRCPPYRASSTPCSRKAPRRWRSGSPRSPGPRRSMTCTSTRTSCDRILPTGSAYKDPVNYLRSPPRAATACGAGFRLVTEGGPLPDADDAARRRRGVPVTS